ncbi:MAG TPA: hypothetical protein QGH10_05930 [Armatimonadota bacterium]|nr:hypothetical protein [Armatimonadota bacterium]
MVKPLAGIFLVLALVLGFQFTYGMHNDLQASRSNFESYRQTIASQAPTFRPFELAKSDGDTAMLSDYQNEDVLLVYLYSENARDEVTEATLAYVTTQNPDRVAVLSVRTAAGADAGPPAEEISSLGDTADDTNGTMMQSYGVEDLPAVVVLKNRPIYHATIAASNPNAGVEETVDVILEGDDLIPMADSEGEGCGGGCGSGGGCGGPGGGAESTGSGESCPASEMIEKAAENA